MVGGSHINPRTNLVHIRFDSQCVLYRLEVTVICFVPKKRNGVISLAAAIARHEDGRRPRGVSNCGSCYGYGSWRQSFSKSSSSGEWFAGVPDLIGVSANNGK